jgi:uncharacterized protein
MAKINFKTLERRVGVVGARKSGKSVLLTALIHQLDNHDAERFKLHDRGDVSISHFEQIPVEPGWSKFDYDRYYGYLSQNEWPSKSVDRSMYSCTFHRSDWRFCNCQLKLLDLPGERFLDAAMLLSKGYRYADWSDHFWSRLRASPQTEEDSKPFQNGLQTLEENQKGIIIREFKRLLAQMRLKFRPNFAPSVFYLDRQGKGIHGKDVEQQIQERFVGLSPESEFAPLPNELRERFPAITAEFEKHFEMYCNELAIPTITELRRCTSIIYLIDIQNILMSGDDVYNDELDQLEKFLVALDPHFGFLEEIASRVRFLPGIEKLMAGNWVEKVAFVCPKIDHVLPEDRDNLVQLLKDFTKKATKKLRDHHVKVEHFQVAAIRTTRSNRAGETHVLEGFPTHRDQQPVRPAEAVQVEVSRVPAQWPLSYQAGEYRFPSFWPNFPKVKGHVPDSIGLDKLFQFVSE